MADETQIREFLRSKEPTQKVFPIPGATLAPETNAAAKGSPSGDVGIPTLDQPPVPRMVSAPSTEESRFLDKYSIPGVPMDMSQEIGGWTRFLSSFRRQKENEIALLQKKYGKDTVRMAEDGRVFVKVKDAATGKDKEIPADSPDINANDLIDLLGSVPEIGAGIIATIKGRKIPGKIGAAEGIRGTARDIVTGSVGAEYTGAVKDVAVSILDRGEPDLGQIAKERATMAVGDIALGGAMSGVYGFSKWIRSPLNSSRTQVQFDALKAKEIIKEKYGIDIPLTVAESTGSPLFSRYEAFKEKLPGGSGAFQKIKRPQEQGLRDLQALMMGVTPEADDIVGQRAIEALQGQVKPIKEGVETAAKAVKTTGRSTIDDLVASATSPTPQPELHLVGKSIREKVEALRNAAKKEDDILYDAVNKAPGGTGKVFPTKKLSERAVEILKSVPGPGNVPLESFAPDDVVKRLKDLINLKGAKLSLSDLQGMRRDTYEAMGSHEGTPGRGKRYLSQIAEALTTAIDDGVEAMPGGQLKTALQKANEHHKTKVVPFSQAGLDELFVQPTDPGRFIGDFEVAKRVFASPDKFRVLKETLGATSPEFVALKRSMADDILRSSSNLDNTLDPASLLRNLKGLRDSSPEMFKEVFGDKAGSIAKTAMQMNVVEDILKGKSIDAQEMAKLLSGGDITTSKLQRLVSAQEQLNTTYRNDILKKVGTGDLDPSSIKPSDFVAKFVESAEPNQLREVLGVLSGSPETMDQVRAKTLELLFRKAARKPTAGDINRVLSDDPTEILSGVSIANILKDKTYREKVRAIVGPDIYSDLENFIKVSATIDAKEAAYATAGGMSAGSVIANIEKRGPLKFMTETAKNWTAAFLMTFPPARAWLARLPTNDPAAIQLMFTSPVMLSAIANEFGEDTKAQEIVLGIRKSLEQFLQVSGSSGQSEPQQGSSNIDNVRSFLRTTNAPVPANP